MTFLWVLTLLGCIVGAAVLIFGSLGTAAQAAAAAGIGVGSPSSPIASRVPSKP